MRTILGIVYLVIGVLVASSQGYLGDVSGIGGILNLVLAVLLWPLLLFGVDFNIRIGGEGRGGRRGAVLPAGFLLQMACSRIGAALRAARIPNTERRS